MNIKGLLISKSWGYWVGTITVILTTIYTMRLNMNIYLGRPRVVSKKVISKIKDTTMRMSIPLIYLSICSIVIGYITKEIPLYNIDNSWDRYTYSFIESTVWVQLPTLVCIGTIIFITIYNPTQLR